MARRTRFEVTDSNGKVHVRTSDCRTYTHAVVTHHRAVERHGHAFPAHSKVEWASRKDLAEKNASSWRGKSHITGVEVLEARNVTRGGSQLPYEQRCDTIVTNAWETWTKNGLGLDQDARAETEKTVQDAVHNTYVNNITDTDWLAATLQRLG